MRDTETIQCPYCGQSMDLVIDVSQPSQRFTTDCEVCCRPFEVVAECEDGELVAVDVMA
jgi:Cysteine-rich CPXCG